MTHETPATRQNTPDHRSIGTAGEDTAATWFTDRGYTLLHRNFCTARGEIDIVLHTPVDHPDHPALVFVEVKWRRTGRYGTGAEAVTPVKLAAMRAAAREWLHRHPGDRPGTVRFDVLDITAGEITHYQGVE